MHDEDRIRQRAYELWEQEGKPEGREGEHWEQACREIEAEGGSPLTEFETASGRLGSAADALREIAVSTAEGPDTAMGTGAARFDKRQRTKKALEATEKVGGSI
jgi:hypothetical protein